MMSLLRRETNILLISILLFFIGCGNSIIGDDSFVDDNFSLNTGSGEETVTLSLSSGSYLYSNGTFATSCYEYLNSSAYNGEGDGTYWVDPDGSGGNSEIDSYCDMTNNGGGWTLLSNQDPIAGNLYGSPVAAESSDITNPTSGSYSIINLVSNFLRNGVYEFYLTWPGGTCAGTPHHWTQTSDPHVSDNAVSGYTSISTPTNAGRGGFNGLCYQGSDTLLRSNCGTDNWWYSVGTITLFVVGAPGCGSAVTQTQLWVR